MSLSNLQSVVCYEQDRDGLDCNHKIYVGPSVSSGSSVDMFQLAFSDDGAIFGSATSPQVHKWDSHGLDATTEVLWRSCSRPYLNA